MLSPAVLCHKLGMSKWLGHLVGARPRPLPSLQVLGAEALVERGPGLPPPPPRRPNLPPPWKFPREGDRRAACLFPPSSPPEAAGSRASMGRQEASWRGRSGGFVSRVGFPGRRWGTYCPN